MFAHFWIVTFEDSFHKYLSRLLFIFKGDEEGPVLPIESAGHLVFDLYGFDVGEAASC